MIERARHGLTDAYVRIAIFMVHERMAQGLLYISDFQDMISGCLLIEGSHLELIY